MHRGRRGPRDKLAQPVRTREHNKHPIGTAAASSSTKRPVRRNLSTEFGDSVDAETEHQAVKPTTKDWVQRAFVKDVGQVDQRPAGATLPKDNLGQVGGSGIINCTWYRNTEEEAEVAKLIYRQHEAWEKANGIIRPSELVENKPKHGPEGLSESRYAVPGEVHTLGTRRSDKARTTTEVSFRPSRQGSKRNKVSSRIR